MRIAFNTITGAAGQKSPKITICFTLKGFAMIRIQIYNFPLVTLVGSREGYIQFNLISTKTSMSITFVTSIPHNTSVCYEVFWNFLYPLTDSAAIIDFQSQPHYALPQVPTKTFLY